MSDDTEVEVQEERPRRGRRAKSEQQDGASDQKMNDGIYFDLDKDTAVTVVCQYSKRREMAERLFSEHRGPDGLLLRVPACGTSVNYQSANGILLGWNTCPCGRHSMIRWVEGAE